MSVKSSVLVHSKEDDRLPSRRGPRPMDVASVVLPDFHHCNNYESGSVGGLFANKGFLPHLLCIHPLTSPLFPRQGGVSVISFDVCISRNQSSLFVPHYEYKYCCRIRDWIQLLCGVFGDEDTPKNVTVKSDTLLFPTSVSAFEASARRQSTLLDLCLTRHTRHSPQKAAR